jgi:hypothetical protein
MLPAAIAIAATLAVGLLLGNRLNESTASLLFAPAILLVFASVFIELAPMKQEFAAYARAWDERDAELRTVDRGAGVTVRTIDSPLKAWGDEEVPIQSCIARYYELSA